MQKYIIKNCPAFNVRTRQCRGAYSNYTEYQYCSGNDNCLLKQIVEKCKEHPLKDCACGDDILSLLEIEEVNE